ncbi:MAG: chemotaxis protein CheA [Methylovulum sp.]|nr:chemotaxis protein CheA [Methylovulum sp.]
MKLDKDMEEVLPTFIIESIELLQGMESDLMALENIEDTEETINTIFRAAHTIKGSAGLFGLDHIVRFTHAVESVLDLLRNGKLSVTWELVAVLLPCCDHLNSLIGDVANGNLEENQEVTECGNRLLDTLQPYLKLDLKTSAATQISVAALHGNAERIETIASNAIESGNWHLFLQFNGNCLRDGMEPLSLIHYLSTLGDIVGLTTFYDAMPDAKSMDPESNYLGFEIILKSDANKETIESVFDFIRDGSQIHILPLENRIPYYVGLIESLTEDNAKLGELLLKSGVITQRELEEGLNTQHTQIKDQPPPSARIGEILVGQRVVQQPLVNAALEQQQQIKEKKAHESQCIRVDADLLDKLIDLVGELVISTAAASLRGIQTGDVALQEANAGVISLVEAVRDSALQLRMMPIGTIFSRFQRVIRDVSRELGKDIKLVISGADTEVDKSIVEKIGDPLLHLVRNAMDHGIERAELRAERGKPAQGTLQLNAYHSSGNIVIEISDDGGGLDREKIYAKAVERGLLPAGAVLSEQELYALIFEPGFSTAEHISNLSGRGVGMDVVKRNITELRGIIYIDSMPGLGTTLRIHLPLTLAIIDGFLAGVGDASFVIPLDKVVECVALPIDDNHDYMELRGEVLPFIRLRQLFQKNGPVSRRQNVIVVEHLGLKAGLVVDRLMGELQAVIKPLGKLFSHVQGVGGSTILGSGEVALIIDVPGLLRLQEQGQVSV